MKDKRFEIVHEESAGLGFFQTILIDKETGVNYLFMKYLNSGGLTPLLDSEGEGCRDEVKRCPTHMMHNAGRKGRLRAQESDIWL